ncbi:cardiolipin synthase [Rhodovarius crocodyli]|uniref:Cardiolipin synthase n=1 Tax=Rhodovarius crocodyli TaxID=1979269 RepID=A0A437MJD5_9PROT|nr:cardiolipin synthase [Rhodovarius crocodyli]RVT97751.1 cardiolipin synthase [Rhodovarius crocodyli]
MSGEFFWGLCLAAAQIAAVGRAILVDGKDPSSRAAWVLALLLLPGLGIAAYLLVGEPWLERRVRRRSLQVAQALRGQLRAAWPPVIAGAPALPAGFRPVFRRCEAIAAVPAVGGNRATVLADADAAIDAMVRDIDAAWHSVHISFYIWLADNNGLRLMQAVRAAARRGVACRVIADGLGSRSLIRSRHWRDMARDGVQLCAALKVDRGLLFFLGNRADLRNHRKIVVIDDRIAYGGSQNAADPEFRIKRRFAPWVDIMLRFQGPVVLQNQLLFTASWMAETEEELALPPAAPAPLEGGFPAIAFGTGPLAVRGAMSDVFVGLLCGAEREVVITTPYFVPDPPVLAALIACARRGVATSLILPARNDSWAVGAIGKAHYPDLLDAGVRVFEFQGGLLHAKTLVADAEVALVGSANMDRRSMELNLENNTLLGPGDIVTQVRARQEVYRAASIEVTRKALRGRGLPRRLWDNALTMFSPLL